MRVLFVRHAAAEERDSVRWPDDRQRPLTERGRDRFERLLTTIEVGRWSPVRVMSSRFVRAWQTAEILSARWDTPAPEASPALEMVGPEAIQECLAAIAPEIGDGTVALVGHEPDLGECLTSLVAGHTLRTSFRVRKGAIIALRLPDGVGAATAIIDWMVHPGLAHQQPR